ncbi:MAG: hypothetical protein ACJASU_002104 [Cognaticolwellia sp.]|jgi:hypothetical protein
MLVGGHVVLDQSVPVPNPFIYGGGDEQRWFAEPNL